MVDGTAPLCFTCGLPSGSTLQFNRLPNGQVCSACRDRLLESIAPALPHRSTADRVPELGAGTSEQEEAHGETDWDGQPRPWPPPGLAS